MRRLASVLFAAIATAAAIQLTAQNQGGTLTVLGKDGPVQGADVRLVQDGKVSTLGATTNNGKFTFNPSLLAGKPPIDLRIDQCPNQQVAIVVFPSGPASQAEEDKCQQGCSCKKQVAVFLWGDDHILRIGQAFADIHNPLFDGLLAGGGAAAIIIATHGGSSTTGGNPGGTTPTFDSITGNYTISATANVTGSCVFNNFNGTFYIGGTTGSTMLQIVELATFNYSGSTTLSGSTFSFMGTGSGSIPGLGTYNGTLSGQILGTGVAGTETLTFNACRVVNVFSGTKKVG